MAEAGTAPKSLAQRYAAVFGAAWAHRKALDGQARSAEELAFLPATQSLQDTPVHPLPRRTAWVLCTLFALAVLWACIGQVDIVAVAPGRIVISERSKTIQPLETSVVRRVLVRDGDLVQAGQTLVELDATTATADEASVREQIKATTSEALRAKAMLTALSTGGGLKLPALNSTTDAATRDQLRAEWGDIAARLAKLDAEAARRDAEVATAQAAVAKIEALLPIVRQREADLASLTGEGFINKHAAQDKARERLELERDLATQRARLSEAQAGLQESRQARAAYVAETRRALSDRQAKASLDQEQLAQQKSKTEQRSRLTRITSPVAGTVQQVAVHTDGGVVTPAQVLMIVVPKEAEVTAEVTLDNKDIGFVQPGQKAEVKLETFSFTKYGTVAATVTRFTADAVVDEKRGAVFPATLQLASSQMDVEGKSVGLSPGMNLTAEIKTGRRRIIEYLLTPVLTAIDESIVER
jgi:hemolysin D